MSENSKFMSISVKQNCPILASIMKLDGSVNSTGLEMELSLEKSIRKQSNGMDLQILERHF
ncbi:hypothetical protein RJ639_026796 [Escallonia herrerae]|uniref:Uncharacterized protein n=1 Tax=Escallonia herrerae TaxID=1293975 RepID=A0AA88X6F3_9ASTE|nr:hypothetical protein RJ639_026796 [Escallonia herrerae]